MEVTYASGIGSGKGTYCGNIIISGGTVTTNGGLWAAGIGSAYYNSSCGNITINGGTVTTTGGYYAAGISNGNIVVNGEGTLQVIDMMGRVIHSGDAKHCVSTAGMAPGVYVLRLIDGEDVRTQKMVVRR